MTAAAETRGASAQEIHAALLLAIREGRHAPGAQLPNERDLARLFGASRAQVRDAMLLLQEAGLVARKVGAGTFVAPNAPRIVERLDAAVDLRAPHPLGFYETIEARLVMEPGVAALAARNIDAAGRARLSAALDAILGAEDWLDFKRRLYLFARVTYEASGNDFLLWAFDRILEARSRHGFDGARPRGAVASIVLRHAQEQLRGIHDAVVAGDEAGAEAATRAYLVGLAASSGPP
jgi:GntR family transcriptional repressor for pyruvate dehydrogenase complex